MLKLFTLALLCGAVVATHLREGNSAATATSPAVVAAEWTVEEAEKTLGAAERTGAVARIEVARTGLTVAQARLAAALQTFGGGNKGETSKSVPATEASKSTSGGKATGTMTTRAFASADRMLNTVSIHHRRGGTRAATACTAGTTWSRAGTTPCAPCSPCSTTGVKPFGECTVTKNTVCSSLFRNNRRN